MPNAALLRCWPAALWLFLSGCGGETARAVGDAADAAIGKMSTAASALTDELSKIDVQLVSPEELRTRASEALSWSMDRLEEVRDPATAEALAHKLDQVLDGVTRLLGAAREELPDKAQLRLRVDELRARLAADENLGDYLEAPLSRLSELLQ